MTALKVTAGEDILADLRPRKIGSQYLDLVLPSKWRQFLASAAPGNSIIYAHARFLPLAIEGTVLEEVREALFLQAVSLVQRRAADGWFLYIAQKRPAPRRGRPRYVPRRVTHLRRKEEA